MKHCWITQDGFPATHGTFRSDTACAHCGQPPKPVDGLHYYFGVDPCLGLLEGVVQACCGHGRKEAYVVIAPGNRPGTMLTALIGHGRTLRGKAALKFFRERGVGPDRLVSVPEESTEEAA